MTIFSSIISGAEVEKAAMDTLQEWLPTYLEEMCRQTGREPGSLPYIRSWKTVNDFESFPEDQIPLLLLISTGLAEPPLKEGDGKYRATWILGTGVVCSGQDQQGSNDLAKLYSAAVRAALLQRPSLGGLAHGTDWEDERYNDLPAENGRTLAAGQNIFSVEVRGVLDVQAGPGAPDPLPDPITDYDPVIAETAELSITNTRGQ